MGIGRPSFPIWSAVADIAAVSPSGLGLRQRICSELVRLIESQRLGEDVGVLVTGASVEKNYAIRRVEESGQQEMIVCGSRGRTFGREQNAFARCPILERCEDLIVCEGDDCSPGFSHCVQRSEERRAGTKRRY